MNLDSLIVDGVKLVINSFGSSQFYIVVITVGVVISRLLDIRRVKK